MRKNLSPKSKHQSVSQGRLVLVMGIGYIEIDYKVQHSEKIFKTPPSFHNFLYGNIFSKSKNPTFGYPQTIISSRVNGSQKMHCITRPSIRALAKKVLSIENSSSQIKKPCAGSGVAPFFCKNDLTFILLS